MCALEARLLVSQINAIFPTTKVIKAHDVYFNDTKVFVMRILLLIYLLYHYTGSEIAQEIIIGASDNR